MSKKKKQKKTLVAQILDRAKIPYEAISFNALEGEKRDDIPPQQIFKTLALKGDKTGPLVGMVPLTEKLSEKKLAKISGNKKVHMIPQKDLETTTGYIHGANNPVGIRQRHKFPIYLDLSAHNWDNIICSAGEVGQSIRINPIDLADFVQAEFADLIERGLS